MSRAFGPQTLPTRPRTRIALFILITLAALPARVPAQPADPLSETAKAAPVELPPLLVTESADAPPWLYANVDGIEYLSRCSATMTRNYAEQWELALQRLSAFVPEWLTARRELGNIVILYSQKLAQVTSPELLQQLKQAAPLGTRGAYGSDIVYRFAPNLRLDDRDMHATFAYVDEMHFEPTRMRVAPAYVRLLLERRTPALPAWFIEGVLEVYDKAGSEKDRFNLKEMFWVDWLTTNGLLRDPEHPRALLPAGELFAPDALRGKLNGNSRRVQTLWYQSTLFVRWALESGPATRDALWRFVGRVSEESPTEELFMACFGFGYSELRDRLSDYLPTTINNPGRFEPPKFPRVGRVSTRLATPAEIARLRGEWERLAADHVLKNSPQLHARYIEQARRTLHRSFDTGDRDPRLLVSLGLCELAAGDALAARFFLEPALAKPVARPRAAYELARLRYANLAAVDPSGGKTYSAAELAPILDLLRPALQQLPPLPEAYALFADATARCATPPPAPDLALLENGARLFARRPEASLPLALVLARHGRKDLAQKLMTEGATYGRDEATRNRFTELSKKLGLSAGP
jgi:hypothetical protein